MKRILSIIICLLMTISCSSISFLSYAAAYSSSKIKAEIENIIDYKIKDEGVSSLKALVEKVLPSQAGVGAEWYALSLIQYDSSLDFSKYRSALEEFVSSGDNGNPVEKEKYALLLSASGYSGDYITDVIENCTGNLGIMSYIYSLHLLNLGYKSKTVNKSDVINALLSLQLSDGGFAISGSYGDVDTTAMVLQAFSQNLNNNKVSKAVEKAILFLEERLDENCEYSSYGNVNSESTSQVIIALSALSIDCCKDSRFKKTGKTLIDTLLSYKQSDGSFAHIGEKGSNGLATVQAFMALVSYYRFLGSKGSIYKFSVSEKEPVTTTEKVTASSLENVVTATDVSINTTAPATTATVPETTEKNTESTDNKTTTRRVINIADFDLLGLFTTSAEEEKTTSTTVNESSEAVESTVNNTVTVSSRAYSQSQSETTIQIVTETTGTIPAETTTQLTTVTETATETSTESAVSIETTEEAETSASVSAFLSEPQSATTILVTTSDPDYENIIDIEINCETSEITSSENTTEASSTKDGSSLKFIIPVAALVVLVGVSCTVIIIKKRR